MSTQGTPTQKPKRKFECKICGAYKTNNIKSINGHLKVCNQLAENGICSECRIYPSESYPATNLNLCWGCYNAISGLDLQDLD